MTIKKRTTHHPKRNSPTHKCISNDEMITHHTQKLLTTLFKTVITNQKCTHTSLHHSSRTHKSTNESLNQRSTITNLSLTSLTNLSLTTPSSSLHHLAHQSLTSPALSHSLLYGPSQRIVRGVSALKTIQKQNTRKQ